MTFIVDQKHMEKLIHLEINSIIKTSIEKVIEEAKQTIEAQIRKDMGKIALSILKNYNVQYDSKNIVITVRNEIDAKA